MPHLLSIQVGTPTEYGSDAATDPHDQRWLTSFYKQPVTGPIRVLADRIEGNEQADCRFHGDADKALLAYSADHYPLWQDELTIPEMSGGGFGENLTISGQTEQTVCIGDRYAIGDVILEVTQPRQPCWKLARRWRLADLPQRVIRHTRTGWYLRVIHPGTIAPGQAVSRLSRPHPEWTIARANQVFYTKGGPTEERRQLAMLPELAGAWREELLSHLSLDIEPRHET